MSGHRPTRNVETATELREDLAGVRAPVYAGLGFALAVVSLYAGYANPYPFEVDPAARSVSIGPARAALRPALVLGVIGAVAQAFHRGGPVLSWFLVGGPLVGGIFGLTAGSASAGVGLDPLTGVLYGLAAVVASVTAAFVIFLFVDVAEYAVRGRWPVGLRRVIGAYAYVLFGVSMVYFVALLVVLLTV